MCVNSTTERDDCDEQLDEPSDEEIARRYVEEHGGQIPNDDDPLIGVRP